jgi:hypothetical protein
MPKKYEQSWGSMTSTGAIMPGDSKVVAPRSAERTFVNSLYTRISIDCAAIDI